MSELPVGGIVPFSAVDYPGCLALVVFCQGCPWRCHYCHNTHLQPFVSKGGWRGVLTLLQRRRGLLDAVVFSGGEPTAHKGLPDAAKEVKSLGFKVGLHTGGSYPNRLQELLPYLDWIGFDIKAPFDRYASITQTLKSGEKALNSASMVIASGIETQWRTTVHPKLLQEADLEEMRTSLTALGAVTPLILQEFRKEGCTNLNL